MSSSGQSHLFVHTGPCAFSFLPSSSRTIEIPVDLISKIFQKTISIHSVEEGGGKEGGGGEGRGGQDQKKGSWEGEREIASRIIHIV